MRQPWNDVDDEADLARFRAMTPAERIELCLQLCDLTDSIVNARPDRERLRAPTAVSPETGALLSRLIREARERAR